MDSLEIQLRRCTRSWLAWTGAVGTSALLFAAIVTTSRLPETIQAAELPPLALGVARPNANQLPPTPHKPRPALAAELAEAFRFDPSNHERPPEIPLGLLDISTFGASLRAFEANSRMGFETTSGPNGQLTAVTSMGQTFEVQKPSRLDRYVIYERDQVDEIPVWLYGPQPRVPKDIEGTVSNVHVFFVITDKGRTEHIYILAADHAEFGENVRKAIVDFRYRPGRKGGKPVRVRVQQTFNTKAEFKSPFSL